MKVKVYLASTNVHLWKVYLSEHIVDIKHKPGLNCSAVILVIQIPTPSINANKMAPTAADLTAADGPPIDDEKYSHVVMLGL